MDSALPLLAALYAGLAGSMHCVTMCGGIAALGGMGSTRPLGHVALFNLGRILSYAFAGAAGAWLVSLGVGFMPSPTARIAVALLTGTVLILIGLYFATGLRLLSAIEGLGGRFWKRLSPLLGRLLPIRHPLEALAVGAAWGWLPCGLVYMTLPLAWSTGRPETGALVMALFGLGTAPAMIGIGLGGGGLKTTLRRPRVRRWAGATMVLFGALMAASPWLFAHGAGHRDHGGESAPGGDPEAGGHRHGVAGQPFIHPAAASGGAVLTRGVLDHAHGAAFRYACGDSDRLFDRFHGLYGGRHGVGLPAQVEDPPEG